MTAESSSPQIRRRKRRLIAGVLLFIAAATIGELLRRDAHRRWLVAEIRAAGGKVRDERSIIQRLRLWYKNGHFPADQTTVALNDSRIDREWLQEHEWLRGLDIQFLVVLNNPLRGDELAKLVEHHPLQEFHVDHVEWTEDVVAALRGKPSLTAIGPTNCDLTDEQMARLPLEQLDDVSLVGTQVTPEGVRQLQRCGKLGVLGLSGEQFTSETANMLASLGTVTHLLLYGPEVTDAHLERVRRIETLEYVDLPETRTTNEGRAALQQAMPQCQVGM